MGERKREGRKRETRIEKKASLKFNRRAIACGRRGLWKVGLLGARRGSRIKEVSKGGGLQGGRERQRERLGGGRLLVGRSKGVLRREQGEGWGEGRRERQGQVIKRDMLPKI